MVSLQTLSRPEAFIFVIIHSHSKVPLQKMAMSKTKALAKTPENVPNLLNEEDFLCAQINDMEHELEEDGDLELSTDSPTPKKKKGFVGILTSGIGRVSGNLLNKLVAAGMQTPLVKYLLSPNTLRKALNNDPILRETYRIIFNSGPVQNLMTPEALKIILDSETAKQIITPETILTILNHDLLVSFMTPETVRFILESEIVLNILRPEVIIKMMESRTINGFLKPEIMHEIAYSKFFTRIMDPDHFVRCLSTSGVRDVMTREAIQDALACPGALRTMTQETVDKSLGVEGVQNLLAHPAFYEHLIMIFEAIRMKDCETLGD